MSYVNVSLLSNPQGHKAEVKSAIMPLICIIMGICALHIFLKVAKRLSFQKHSISSLLL